MYEVLLVITVALIWGFTNPLMKYGIDSKVKSTKRISENLTKLRWLIEEIKLILFNWKYILAYGINQLGSLLYYYTLGQAELSFVGPLTNCLTFVFTFLFGHFIFGERSQLNGTGWLGLGLVLSGITLCLFDKLLM